MKKLLLLLLSIIVASNVNGQGLKLSSPDNINNFEEFKSDDFGFASSIPSSYDLKKYVPPVRQQKGGTCVGFSTFYYALSTMYNIQFDITSYDAKFVHSFDPYYFYSLYYRDKAQCDSGLQFNIALNSLKKIGSKKLLYPPFTTCDEEWDSEKFENTLDYTMPYSINEWYTIKSQNPNYLNNIKKLVYNDYPVIIGVEVGNSLYPYKSDNTNGVGSSGLWSPEANEIKEGGHAMCIVGYDDYKYGGAFLIVNSWGKDYGNEGYIWIRYRDFRTHVKESYIIDINKNVQNKPPTEIVTPDYKRYRYITNNNNYSFYEGQFKSNSITGYGIWSDTDNDAFYVGKYKKGEMDGFFLIFDNEGFGSANAVNGNLQDIERFGFGSDEAMMETQISAKKFFQKLGTEFTIRKANSTKTNKPKKN
jgi:C1A family cysteine protease